MIVVAVNNSAMEHGQLTYRDGTNTPYAIRDNNGQSYIQTTRGVLNILRRNPNNAYVTYNVAGGGRAYFLNPADGHIYEFLRTHEGFPVEGAQVA